MNTGSHSAFLSPVNYLTCPMGLSVLGLREGAEFLALLVLPVLTPISLTLPCQTRPGYWSLHSGETGRPAPGIGTVYSQRLCSFCL